MAIKSMTGFGRAELEHGLRQWTVEIRSVNNRYLDLKMKLPRGYAVIEERIRKSVAALYLRGRVDLFLNVSGDFSDLQDIRVNMALARQYRDACLDLAEEMALADSLTNTKLAAFPEVIERIQKEEDAEAFWPVLEQVVGEALARSDQMRSQEGAVLAQDLKNRLSDFEHTVSLIEEQVPTLVAQRQKGLEERLEKLLGMQQLDPARLAQEVALLADKTDVTEELVRLRCHIGQFRNFLEEESGIGRKLDFLIQEFLREVNTLASKISDAAIAHLTVELKSELEKMREQVQNIE